jgi:hypothetical protein
MTKKNIKVKKGKGDISITIENNLNANNKQINHQPIKRRRRKKKVEDNEEINNETLKQSLQELPPLKDVSYIKPGPVGAFKIWQNTMDSYNTTVPMNQAQQLGLVPPQLPAPPTPQALPAPPAQPALPAPPAGEKPLTLENFKEVMSMIREQQQQPPPEWGRNLVDDDDNDGPRMPTSPAFSRLSKPSDLELDMDFANELENSIAEEYGKEVNDPEIKEVGKEVQKILNKARAGTEAIQAKRFGTLHAKKKWAPTGKYKDTEAYQIAYNTVLNQGSQKDDVIPGEGKTRAQKKALTKVQISNPIESDAAKLLFSKEELDEINEQAKKLNEQLEPFENWNIERRIS